MSRRHNVAISLALAVLILCASACRRVPAVDYTSTPLPEWGYLWQRDWTPAVTAGFHQATHHLNGIAILGVEIQWQNNTPAPIRATIDWPTLANSPTPIALAIRIGKYPGPFATTGPMAAAILAETQRLLTTAAEHHIPLTELQLDYDSPQRNLPSYQIWVTMLRKKIAPLPLVITALPSWLAEPAFPALARSADSYVLQVHSVPTLAETGHASLCDTRLARQWIATAATIGAPFRVSLPAYWCLAGYDTAGHLIGVAMDSIQPAWPAGTSTLEFSANADDLALLVADLQKQHPASLQSLIWYRIPIPTDQRAWRWPTLAAVMAGRQPTHRIQAICTGSNPVDTALINNGEAEERTPCTVTLTWSAATVTASDALPGWSLTAGQGTATFTTLPGPGLRLSPGDRRAIGWLRYDRPVTPRASVTTPASVIAQPPAQPSY